MIDPVDNSGAVRPDVRRLLEPRAVAVIGASDDPASLGGQAVRYLRRFGYPGRILPVNPKRDTVAGLPCYPTVADLPETVDLAILAVSARIATGLIDDCVRAGIPGGVVWAGGFAEVGAAGRQLQEELTAVCHRTGFALIGPNCIGFINTSQPSIASFASFLAETDELLPGRISMVSQSGGLATMAMALAQGQGIGFRYMVSTGNEAVLSLADFITAFTNDPVTTVIVLYLEGVGDGARITRALRAAQQAGKTVVILRGGSAPAGAAAAAAHTGALAGEDRVFRAVASELGAIVVDSLEELLDVCCLLVTTDPAVLPQGRAVSLITFGGGIGVLSADQAAKAGLTTPQPAPETIEKLRPLVPPIASLANPVDLTPQAYNDATYRATFAEALAVIAADDSVDMVLAEFGPMSSGSEAVIDGITRLRDTCGKAVALAWTLPPSGVVAEMRARNFHVFDEPARAVRALARCSQRSRLMRAKDPQPDPATFDWAAHLPTVEAGTNDTVVTEADCHRVLTAAGLPVAVGELVTDAAALDTAVERVGLPVVMKGINASITHRDAAGLVRLGVASPGQAQVAYGELTDRADELGVPLDGVYLQRMVRGGVELLVSALRDPIFGVMVSCGAGGTLTEFFDDVVLARAPVDETVAHDLLRRLRIVDYARRKGLNPDLTAAARFVARLSAVAAAAPWPAFTLEVNPVKVAADEVMAVDGLLLVGSAR